MNRGLKRKDNDPDEVLKRKIIAINQYTSHAYQGMLPQVGAQISMSRRVRLASSPSFEVISTLPLVSHAFGSKDFDL
ncbi:hypothetical protein [Paenibacillus sp. FSL R10-2734]|uniref:hypothetical protein n=1 Tax=Paenibacillus sp. FSL R10-2734 TaxID=2954691 RepID=UPI0030D7E88E